MLCKAPHPLFSLPQGLVPKYIYYKYKALLSSYKVSALKAVTPPTPTTPPCNMGQGVCGINFFPTRGSWFHTHTLLCSSERKPRPGIASKKSAVLVPTLRGEEAAVYMYVQAVPSSERESVSVQIELGGCVYL
jgi:hypothetical protein